jgi:hypothetical protein
MGGATLYIEVLPDRYSKGNTFTCSGCVCV